MAASSRTAPGGGRSHARLEPGGLTLVGEQLGILLVGGKSVASFLKVDDSVVNGLG